VTLHDPFWCATGPVVPLLGHRGENGRPLKDPYTAQALLRWPGAVLPLSLFPADQEFFHNVMLEGIPPFSLLARAHAPSPETSPSCPPTNGPRGARRFFLAIGRKIAPPSSPAWGMMRKFCGVTRTVPLPECFNLLRGESGTAPLFFQFCKVLFQQNNSGDNLYGQNRIFHRSRFFLLF